MLIKSLDSTPELFSLQVVNGGGNLVASATAAQSESGWGVVVDLFVEQTFRGLGIGADMVAKMQEWAVENGMLGIAGVLGSPFPDANPARAIQFYQNSGFVVDGGIITWVPSST